jgi:hypothetical protein
MQSLAGGNQPQAPSAAPEDPEQTPTPTGPEDLTVNYVYARKPTNLRKDGYQREMTDLEYQTLHLWLTRKIYLEKYPRFLRATMVNMQRDVFADHHMKHLVYTKGMCNLYPVTLRLNPSAPPLTLTAGFSSLKPGEMCRYLGIQVGRGIVQGEVWNLTFSQIEKRLAMAAIKTHSVYQRVALAAAVILPKALFVARHHWPTTACVKSLDTRIRNFVWSGLFVQHVPQGSGTQHWMNRKLAFLHAKEGGLGIPDISLELITLAAQVVARWGYCWSK